MDNHENRDRGILVINSATVHKTNRVAELYAYMKAEKNLLFSIEPSLSSEQKLILKVKFKLKIRRFQVKTISLAQI